MAFVNNWMNLPEMLFLSGDSGFIPPKKHPALSDSWLG